MTNSSPASALTDEQLIEKVLSDVMKWQKRWMRTLGEESWCEKEIIDGKPFWSSRCLVRYQMNYLTDWNHTMEVVEKVRSHQVENNDFLDFELASDLPGGEWMAIFGSMLTAAEGGIGVKDKNPQRAILLAALQAVSQ